MLHFYTFVVGLGAFQFGWAVVGNTQTAPVMSVKFGWNHEEAMLYNTLISNSSILGLFIGSIFASKIIGIGRRKAIILMNVIIVIGTGISLILTIPTLIIGRFISGFAAGVLTICVNTCIYETVPLTMASSFGAHTSIAIDFAGLFCLLLGLTLPEKLENFAED